MLINFYSLSLCSHCFHFYQFIVGRNYSEYKYYVYSIILFFSCDNCSFNIAFKLHCTMFVFLFIINWVYFHSFLIVIVWIDTNFWTWAKSTTLISTRKSRCVPVFHLISLFGNSYLINNLRTFHKSISETRVYNNKIMILPWIQIVPAFLPWCFAWETVL